MAATFDLWQQAYTLATMSGSVSTQQGAPATLASALANTLATFYQDTDTIAAIGQWSTVWGPRRVRKRAKRHGLRRQCDVRRR